MLRRVLTLLMVATLAFAPLAAQADNKMGYRLLSADEAASLPGRQGALGLEVGTAQQITSADLTFLILGVKAVRPGSPAAQAGFHPGDEIIAIDGRVFPSLAVFAKFIGSLAPGSAAAFDYIPSGGGPEQAQRLSVTIGGPGQAGAPGQRPQEPAPKERSGLSTGQKIAIGIGAAALFGCYKLGCFKKRQPKPQPGGQPQFRQQN